MHQLSRSRFVFLALATGLLVTSLPLRVSAQAVPAAQTNSAPPAPAVEDGQSAAGVSAPDARTVSISATAIDLDGDVIPDASAVLQGPDPDDRRSTVANDDGAFSFVGLKAGVPYHVTIRAKGFVDWTSPDVVLAPGQFLFLPNVGLTLRGGETSVTVSASSAQLATEEVRLEEQQRVFGLLPNFYVAYDPHAAPLTAKLKFKLALKVSFDPVTAAGVLFLAGINQAADTPDYVQGFKGYGQRAGAVAASGFTDIFIGGAILPALLHQDPRYFYQGTGTTRSRLLHALSSPFICKGDNGRWQPNYSTIGGDLGSSAIADLYYPRSDRGAGQIAENVLVNTAERTLSTVVQEFVLRKFTSGPKRKN